MSEFGVYLLDKDSYEKVWEVPITSAEFDIALQSGCGLAKFRLPWRLQFYDRLTSAYIYWPVRIDILDNPIWQGVIESIRPMVQGDKESMEVSCSGWGLFMRNVRYQYQYRKGDEIVATGVTITKWSDIVRDLFRIVVEKYPQLSIGRVDDTADMPDATSGYTATAFNMKYQSIYDAMKTLAILAGNWQWGVDRERKLYFYPEETSIAYQLQVGKQLKTFKPILDASKIVNNILLRGGVCKEEDTGREFNFFREGRDLASINQFGTHFEVRHEPTIRDIAVADLYMSAVFAQYAYPQDRVEIEITANYGLFEPYKGRVHVFISPDGHHYYRITKTRYRLTDAGVTVKPELGYPPPDIVGEMVSLKAGLNQLMKEGATEEYFHTWYAAAELYPLTPNLSFEIDFPV